MYRRRGYRRSRRRRKEQQRYLQRILLGVSVLCIIIACAAVAVKTRKATQTVEAATALMQAADMTVKTQDMKESGAEDDAPAEVDEPVSTIVIDPGHGGWTAAVFPGMSWRRISTG